MKNKRQCRKCGNKIPYYINIDNVSKSLQNRKFCLICSPYRGHNTSPYDPIMRTRKQGEKYSKYSIERKNSIKISLYKRALERKRILIKKLGGKCCKCGYNKCTRALIFHHKRKKSFGLSLNYLWSKSWKTIIKEIQKCLLVCANCHAELHEKISNQKDNIVAKVNRKYGTNY